LTISCNDRPGIVAAVTTTLFEAGANILEAQQFDDVASKKFFMRVEFDVASDAPDEAALRVLIEPVAARFAMQWRVRSRTHKQRVLFLVSKFDHCLGDLLYRFRIGELQMDVVGIISNHPRESLTELPETSELIRFELESLGARSIKPASPSSR
jgi:formyltetrahydrofolate deformylase